MSIAHNIHHRRAAAAHHRRQLGFDPTAIFGGIFGDDDDNTPSRPTTTTDIFGGLTGILFPTPTNDDLPSITSTSASTSSSSSSSTSASSETTTSTTLTPTTTSQATTTTPPPVQQTTVVTPTVITSLTNSRVSTSASSTLVASATSTAEASTGLSTGAVVGGIGAGIVAIAALGFAVTFFIRRARKREANAFDDHDFRRSAMVLNDPPTHEDTVARGYNPRPPSMVERRLGSSPPPFGNGYDNYNQDYYGDNRAGYGAGYQQPSFTPGQVIGMDNGAPSPMMANSAHPMYPDAAYTQSPFSPIGTPVSEYGQYPGHSQYPDHPSLARQASNAGAYPVLTRQSSQESHHGPHSPPRAPHTQLEQENIPANDYVDLSRASVSPFQAAQYAEISRRLNTEVPAGMPTPDVEREMPPPPPPKYNSMDASPFADPSSAPPSPGGQYVVDKRRPASAESETLEFPVPPSPAHTTSSRYRIDSMPPTLPEIQVESRVSVSQYTMKESAGPAPLATASKAPAGPSPLAASYAPSPTSPVAPAPPPAAATASTAKAPHAAEPQLTNEQKRGTTYSVYDPEDAYGGF